MFNTNMSRQLLRLPLTRTATGAMLRAALGAGRGSCKERLHAAADSCHISKNNASFMDARDFTRTGTESLPKSRNCFMDNGEGENLENLSTCFGIPRTEPFFNRNWPSFIFPAATKAPVFPAARPGPQLKRRAAQPRRM